MVGLVGCPTGPTILPAHPCDHVEGAPVTTVIGPAPNERGAAAVHLGSMLARSIADVVVVTVVLSRGHPVRTGLTTSTWRCRNGWPKRRWQLPQLDRPGPVGRARHPPRTFGVLRPTRGLPSSTTPAGPRSARPLAVCSVWVTGRGGRAASAHLGHPGDSGIQGLRHGQGRRPRLPDHGGFRSCGRTRTATYC